MEICGFQKMTLLDFPGRVSCIVFTGGCNFRCPFCHNASLVIDIDKSGAISENEFFSYIQKRNGVLDGVVISGGEPLLHSDIIPFIEKIKSTSLAVKLDTNGSRPALLREILSRNLVDYVAMDIKNCKEKYALTAGVKNLDITNIEESVNILMNGNTDFEFRTTVVNELHSLDDFVKIGEWIKGTKKYYIQNFVNSGELLGTGYSAPPQDFLLEISRVMAEYVGSCEIRGI